ncbi:MAG: class I SAM-dependent methyltransferase [Devosia sp.]
MIKQAYVRVAQAIPSLIPGGSSLYASPGEPRLQGVRRWLASLGAIYHLDRMIALDIPWWNVASVRDVELFLQRRGDARVFEYGSGASTIWLARRAASVISVEHDAEWAAKMKTKLSGFANVQLITAEYDADGPAAEQPYVRSIEGTGQFDMIVVDGRLRVHCLQQAITQLKPDGIILFDDSGRKRYRAAIDAGPLREKHYYGASYCVPYPDHTSILTATAWP